jgi:tripartite ATP-independent transporter DctP family solute receptor
MKRTAVLVGFMVGCFFVVSGWGIVSYLQAATEIKLGHVDPADVCISKKGAAGATFKGLVEGGSGGSVNVKVFPASQLGNERELIEGVKLGTIQMAFVSGAIAGFYKQPRSWISLPLSSGPVAWKVMDGWFGKELAADILKQTGMRVLAYGETGFRNFTNSKGPIKSPADMKGLKIRVMETPVYVNMVKALGAAPTPIAWSETYTALQQKVVDGQENPVATIMQAKLYEVQKYMILDGHSYGCDFFLINDKFYQGLPKETQELLKTSAYTAAVVGRGVQHLNSATGISEVQTKGMQVYAPTAAERAQFKAATQKPVRDYVESQIGKTWIDKLMKAIQEAEAEMVK